MVKTGFDKVFEDAERTVIQMNGMKISMPGEPGGRRRMRADDQRREKGASANK